MSVRKGTLLLVSGVTKKKGRTKWSVHLWEREGEKKERVVASALPYTSEGKEAKIIRITQTFIIYAFS